MSESIAMAGMPFDPHAYTIVVRRVYAEGEYVFHGRVIELPDLEAFEPTYDEAYGFLIDAIQTSKTVFDEKGREFPAPLPEENTEYSGRVTIRMPRWLHAQLDYCAQMDGTSLNQYMVAVLASTTWHTRVPQNVGIGSTALTPQQAGLVVIDSDLSNAFTAYIGNAAAAIQTTNVTRSRLGMLQLAEPTTYRWESGNKPSTSYHAFISQHTAATKPTRAKGLRKVAP